MKKEVSTDIFVLVILLLTYLVLCAVVSPLLEFPLNDDWGYSLVIKDLCEGGRFWIPTNWTSATFVGQFVFAVPLVWLFGFSFSILKISTLAFSVLGAWFLYLSLRELEVESLLSLLGALVLVFNPLYLSLSYSFMTDVPNTSVMFMAMFFFLRGMRTNKAWWWIFAGIATLWSILIRQSSAVIPLGFAMCLLFYWRDPRRIPMLIWMVAIPVCGYFLYLLGLRILEFGSQQFLTRPFMPITTSSLDEWPKRAFYVMHYFSVFTFPIWCSALFSTDTVRSLWRNKKLASACILTAFYLTTLVFVRYLKLFPYAGNCLINLGIGPYTLNDIALFGFPYPVSLPTVFWFVISYISCFGIAFILFAMPRFVKQLLGGQAKHQLPIVLIGGLYFGIQISLTFFFDRYFLFLLLPSMVILFHFVQRTGFSTIVFVSCLAVLAASSILLTKDYHAWNGARWEALNYLTDVENVSPSRIDGGYEFNGWYLYKKYEKLSMAEVYYRFKDKGFLVEDNQYVVSFHYLKGYSVYKVFPYNSPLVGDGGKVLVLKRKPRKTATDRTIP